MHVSVLVRRCLVLLKNEVVIDTPVSHLICWERVYQLESLLLRRKTHKPSSKDTEDIHLWWISLMLDGLVVVFSSNMSVYFVITETSIHRWKYPLGKQVIILDIAFKVDTELVSDDFVAFYKAVVLYGGVHGRFCNMCHSVVFGYFATDDCQLEVIFMDYIDMPREFPPHSCVTWMGATAFRWTHAIRLFKQRHH